MSFITQYYDPALEISRRDTAEGITLAERERLTRMLAVAEAAAAIPRRLGAEASGEELAADKKRAKRMAHALQQSLKAWGGPLRDKPEVAQEAAQLRWDVWWADHQVMLANRVRYVVTWCTKAGGDERWTKSAVVKLQNEQRWIEYALR